MDDHPLSQPQEVGQESLTVAHLDMLIRSGSTFLSIVSPQQSAKSSMRKDHRDYKSLRQLDRIATLFVTKERAQVSPAMVKQLPDSVILYVTDPIPQFDIQEIYSISNSKGNDVEEDIRPPVVGKTYTKDIFEDTWLEHFLDK